MIILSTSRYLDVPGFWLITRIFAWIFLLSHDIPLLIPLWLRVLVGFRESVFVNRVARHLRSLKPGVPSRSCHKFAAYPPFSDKSVNHGGYCRICIYIYTYIMIYIYTHSHMYIWFYIYPHMILWYTYIYISIYTYVYMLYVGKCVCVSVCWCVCVLDSTDSTYIW